MQGDPRDQAQQIIERLAATLDPDDAKSQAYVVALRDELLRIEAAQVAMENEAVELREAYDKLTAPANRVGTYLGSDKDGLATVTLGDSEFVVTVDPKIDPAVLEPGTRVRLNEAYAVVGVVEPCPIGGLAKVAEVLEDDRLQLGSEMDGAPGRVVGRAKPLEGKKVRSGDHVLLDPTSRLAVEHFSRKASSEYFVEEVPDMPWESIGGQDKAIETIREVIELPMLHPELFSKFQKTPPKGVLLYGPPGCGKTMIGKAIAYNLANRYSEKLGREVKDCFLHVSGPKILNMWLGETERFVREIFSTARERAKEGEIVVIFLDEAESILRTRSTGRMTNINNTVVPQFCAEMDGIVGLENVVTVLTSNRPDYIDPAVLRPERIDRKVKVERPDKNAARQILGLYLTESLPFAEGLLVEHHEAECVRAFLVEQTVDKLWSAETDTEFVRVTYRSGTSKLLHWRDFVSGALLKSVVDRAKDYAIKRAIDDGSEGGLTLDDMLAALAQEFKENEIFPKGDAADDWVKLLDVEPASVVAVRPVSEVTDGDRVRNRVS
ncbi:MAG: AAA family ATPase [Fimbriimonadaceae bacterium]